MLVELKNVRQIKGEGRRRWFRDESFDLIVWYTGDEMVGFQLCYKKNNREHALTWRADGGYSHNRIDDGERVFVSKMTPILVADGAFDRESVSQRFLAAARNLEPELAAFIHEKLKAYPA